VNAITSNILNLGRTGRGADLGLVPVGLKVNAELACFILSIIYCVPPSSSRAAPGGFGPELSDPIWKFPRKQSIVNSKFFLY
jgi:hypothetical protein